jgi:hypothetical protein
MAYLDYSDMGMPEGYDQQDPFKKKKPAGRTTAATGDPIGPQGPADSPVSSNGQVNEAQATGMALTGARTPPPRWDEEYPGPVGPGGPLAPGSNGQNPNGGVYVPPGGLSTAPTTPTAPEGPGAEEADDEEKKEPPPFDPGDYDFGYKGNPIFDGLTFGPMWDTEEKLQRDLLNKVLLNPYTLTDDRLAMLGEQGKEQSLNMQKQVVNQMRQNAAARGVVQGGQLGASERRLGQETVADLLRQQRDLKVMKFQKDREDEINALATADSTFTGMVGRRNTMFQAALQKALAQEGSRKFDAQLQFDYNAKAQEAWEKWLRAQGFPV